MKLRKNNKKYFLENNNKIKKKMKIIHNLNKIIRKKKKILQLKNPLRQKVYHISRRPQLLKKSNKEMMHLKIKNISKLQNFIKT